MALALHIDQLDTTLGGQDVVARRLARIAPIVVTRGPESIDHGASRAELASPQVAGLGKIRAEPDQSGRPSGQR